MRTRSSPNRATGTPVSGCCACSQPSTRTSRLARQVPEQLARAQRAETEPPPARTANDLQAVEKPTPRAPAIAAPTPVSSKRATITAIRRAVLPDVVRVTIALDAEVPFHDERIEGPARIFVDLPASRATASLTDRTLRFDGDSDLVRQVRIGRHSVTTTRIVLDAIGVSSYSVYPMYNPYRLVIDCARSTQPARPPRLAAAAPIAAHGLGSTPEGIVRGVKPAAIVLPPPVPPRLASRRVSASSMRALPASAPRATSLLNAALMPPLAGRAVGAAWTRALPGAAPAGASLIAAALSPAALPTTTTAAAAAAPGRAVPPAPPTPSSLSMARQLGLGVSKIVIDPGHGGHDPGARGKGGLTEAELVLDISLRVQKLLMDRLKGVEVVLTRQTDCFVPLQERTAIANREGADLFLSVHANASANSQARGVETYFLSFANNLGAAAVAARENAASGQAMGALPDFVKAIALNNKLDESKDFATIVQQALVDRLQLTNKSVRNLGVKQAPFLVLIGASMPSVLAEISFVTNPQEARLLKSSAYRQRIAESLFDAVRSYQTSLTRSQSVAVH